MDSKTYLDATQENGKNFIMRQIKEDVVMLNLLKYRDIADYSNALHLAPEKAISGAAAYRLYIDLTIPFLEKAGGEVLFHGKGGHFLIGPENEHWDAVLLVKHASVAKFLEFAQNQEYLAIAGHRNAALEDSRLMPVESLS